MEIIVLKYQSTIALDNFCYIGAYNNWISVWIKAYVCDN